jgi:AcrR family transcriptional regulator
MSPDDRRQALVQATLPLLYQHGRGVTTRQIAEAAGVAEGTVFRAFGDKETLITAAVERHLDPEPFRRQLALIDPALPLEHKVRAVIALLQSRFAGIFSLMSALGQHERPKHSHSSAAAEYAGVVAEMLRPDLARLSWPAERVAPLIRLIAFSTSLPMFNEQSPFGLDDLTRFVLYGIAGGPGAAAASPAVSASAFPGHNQ